VFDGRDCFFIGSFFFKEHAHMKVRKLVWPWFLLCVLLAACEEKTEGGAEGEAAAPAAEGAAKPEAAPAPKEPPIPGPQDVCTTMLGALKAKDEAKVLSLSTPATAAALGAEGAKEHFWTALGPVTCGTAKIEGDNAMVPLTGGEAVQEAVFTKASDGWKFDGAQFLTKYPPAEKADKAAKGKGKGKKGKGKGKKHK
jgi:hypothetical protein